MALTAAQKKKMAAGRKRALAEAKKLGMSPSEYKAYKKKGTTKKAAPKKELSGVAAEAKKMGLTVAQYKLFAYGQSSYGEDETPKKPRAPRGEKVAKETRRSIEKKIQALRAIKKATPKQKIVNETAAQRTARIARINKINAEATALQKASGRVSKGEKYRMSRIEATKLAGKKVRK